MDLEIHYAGDWAALYKDGKLVRVGDSYRTEEEAFEILGVPRVQNDAFMLGQNSRAGVAKTLDEVDAYIVERLERATTAAEKRAAAEKLLAEADELASR